MIDNHLVPAYLEPINFWGLKAEVPNDRTFNSRKEFSRDDETELEENNHETVTWKKRIDEIYK